MPFPHGLRDLGIVAGWVAPGAVLDAQVLNDQLDQALTSRIVIEQAKGMLAALDDLTMDEAFNSLRNHARRNNQRLADVARSVIDGTLNTTNVDP